MEEIWKNIQEYNGKYQVSNLGNVKGVVKGKEKNLKTYKSEKGYSCVFIFYKGKLSKRRIHKLVAEAFLDKNEYKMMEYEDKENIDINKLQINHKDENKDNNCFCNLEWCTCSYNINYGKRNNNTSNKLSKKVRQFDLKRNFIKEWDSLIEVEKNMGIPIGTIYSANFKRPINGYYWEYDR